ncbi:LacI family transcriptional regulator [Caldalkalibacillus uzonensis]|uniref:LacI family transcriptional regulator n=1 Tax=Caldalkalibacillus uzonensis TaxID=353224 RepID=A0ABU0CS42_9BACI|nr:LacI family DNA-binding transcriptional regulator [Caldalkalibacillus uzonensis]MDQ0338325.1 LacI family transcriptional regulator [Caldalkalibacillus uzonensis]
MVTIYDIAKKANVSPMTVSRVINNSGNISEKTRKKVEKVIREMNYIPNSAARSLISKETKILALLITDITNPFFTKVARGAEDKALEKGYRLILSNSDENLYKETDYFKTFISTPVDGIIFAPTGDESKKNIQLLNDHQIPFVLVDREIPGIQCDQVLGDNHSGSRQLLDYLYQKGHRKIALINGPATVSTARERQKAYMEFMREHSLVIHPEWILETNYKQGGAITAVETLLSLPNKDKPTAIFAANNFIAIDAINTLKKYNYDPPHDIDIVCFDDLESYSWFPPFLTVAVQPAYDFGYTATQLLIERIEKKSPTTERKVILTPKIVYRN